MAAVLNNDEDEPHCLLKHLELVVGWDLSWRKLTIEMGTKRMASLFVEVKEYTIDEETEAYSSIL